ncbi:NAD(P)H-binding protein [Kocuria sp. JC486]|nr:NAD(P)H-binding protein [Kocuria sp. JC486]
MHISIIGAAGMVGSQIAVEAENRGHDVHRYTRSGRPAGDAATEALDFNDTATVTEVVNGSEVTVVSVAGRGDYDGVVAAHRNLIAAQPSGRILVVGGAGALRVGDSLLLESPDFPAEYLTEAKAFARVLEEYSDSADLNWTMIAPSPEIAPGARTGQYLDGGDSPAGGFVSTQDFAVAAVDEAESASHARRRFSVASADEAAARG